MERLNRVIKIRLLLVLLLSVTSCNDDSKYAFNYVSPGSKGYSSEKLEALKTHLETSGSSALMIMVDGAVIFDWGATKKKHTIHSIRKAMLNSLYGIAVEQGLIDTSMTLRELDIDDIESCLSENELDARIVDLLKSRSGVYHDAAGVSEDMLRGKPERDAHKPGEHFYYNNWDFNVLGAIIEEATGQSLYELFEDEIAGPLGMHDYKGRYCSVDGESEDVKIPGRDGFYQYEKSKSKYPACHFRMSARDLVLYGQLFLDRGNWNGKQLIPETWIETSTRPCSVYNHERGIFYGMLWYVTDDLFYHTGAGIHMLAVCPDLGMVFVHRVDTEHDFSYRKEDLHKTIELIFAAAGEGPNRVIP
ncbi:MAG: serine hydrolase [Bacteroidales bacterium]|nr:serine hydrolase [Bacteroidales bacterium]